MIMIHRILFDCSNIGAEYVVDDLDIVNLSYGSIYCIARYVGELLDF
jgi:hypothetical protein